MPTYEYECLKCKKEFEVFQSMKDEALKHCTCGKKGKVRRKIGKGAGLIFKGTGFYITDYKKKPQPPKSEAAPASDAKSESKPAARPASEKSSSSSADSGKKGA